MVPGVDMWIVCPARQVGRKVIHLSTPGPNATSLLGYTISQRIRKRIEEGFGWMKTVGRLRKTMHRGVEKIAMQLDLHAAAYNLVRMANLGLGAT
jgi:hypothetical protein